MANNKYAAQKNDIHPWPTQLTVCLCTQTVTHNRLMNHSVSISSFPHFSFLTLSPTKDWNHRFQSTNFAESLDSLACYLQIIQCKHKTVQTQKNHIV